ncbi:monocarboxylate transporter 6 isoform X1 [Octopus sinensis]|uniref:Monocarboxylate transporter 6 isoform X1 n=1 Tax=Octopus sinensis TaxID=2607531 RepID=A0A7E6FLZ0_9MOLL|nr:monocarboxylate transporter 6 isoform X1 [Octopus sinensis]
MSETALNTKFLSKDVSDTPEEPTPAKKKRRYTVKQYMVLVGAWVNLYMCIALPSSLTVIYVEFIYHLDSSRANAGLVVSLCGGMRGCAGILAGLIVNRIGAKWTIFLGSVFTSSGIFSSCFAPNVIVLCITLGAITGTGYSFINVGTFVALGDIFGKKISNLSIVITMARPLAAMTMPIIIKFLMDIYGWRSSLLLLSAFNLHICAFCIVMSPDKKKLPPIPQDVEDTSSEVDSTKPEKKPKKFFHLSVFNEKMYLVFMVLLTFLNSSYSGATTVMVDVGVGRGFGLNRTVFVLTLRALSALCSRSISAIIHRTKCISNISMLCFTGLSQGCGLLILSYSINYSYFVLGNVIIGMSGGTRNCMTPAIIMGLVGIERYASGLGLTTTMTGFGEVISGPLAGKIADISNNYQLSLFLSSMISLISASLVMLVPAVMFWRSHCQKKEETTENP